MPEDWCPFCKGSGMVPDDGFAVLRYPNDFPALSVNPPQPDNVATELFKVAPPYGRCEVLLYSDEHEKRLWQLSNDHLLKLAEMWRETYQDFASDAAIKYTFIFENRGEAVGVTMPHPHGQVYGYPFVPDKIKREHENVVKYHHEEGTCLFCDMLKAELADGRRIIFENEHFAVYLPFFAPTAYGVYVAPKYHVTSIAGLTDAALGSLVDTISRCTRMYDNLFDDEKIFPYMMGLYNPPKDADESSWHFHVKFFSVLRSKTKQQFAASSETCVGAYCNPTSPEEKADELRKAALL
jgi:UDPglucose--hexose-1-phosphate uridylyltransferase